jgi:predicted DNA-binding ribbon-helix-helix protein
MREKKGEIYIQEDSLCQPVRDAALFASRSRSIRVRGVVTSVRLENSFWRVLAEIAVVRGVSLSRLVTSLVTMDGVNEVASKASFLRVICLQYLRSKAQSNAFGRLSGKPNRSA